jgi:hypothetical protein
MSPDDVPRKVDILVVLLAVGIVRRFRITDPDGKEDGAPTKKEAHDIFERVCNELDFHGIRVPDAVAVMDRLGARERLTGYVTSAGDLLPPISSSSLCALLPPSPGNLTAVGPPPELRDLVDVLKPDLTQVACDLRLKDSDRIVARNLWAWLCQGWPVFATLFPAPAPQSDNDKLAANSNVDQEMADAGGAPTATKPAAAPSPAVYLQSWSEILDSLEMKNTEVNRGRVRGANERFEGPINIPKQGGQPKANKAKLLEWWNGLEMRWEAGGAGQITAATLENRHNYGRDGEVVPDIGGHTKKRRGKQ